MADLASSASDLLARRCVRSRDGWLWRRQGQRGPRRHHGWSRRPAPLSTVRPTASGGSTNTSGMGSTSDGSTVPSTSTKRAERPTATRPRTPTTRTIRIFDTRAASTSPIPRCPSSLHLPPPSPRSSGASLAPRCSRTRTVSECATTTTPSSMVVRQPSSSRSPRRPSTRSPPT